MSKKYISSFGEEVGNAVSHGAMSAITLLALPVAAIYSFARTGSLTAAVGVSIFGVSIFLMFLASTLYHSMSPASKHKQVFQILDHIFIYVAIAGSYTPIALCLFDGPTRIIVLAIEWIAVIGGILLKSISNKSHPVISGIIYLSMGWAALFFLPKLIANSSPIFLALIVLGGVLYTIGMIFYSYKKKYFHFVWHLFIDFACILHFIAIVFFM